MQQRVSWQRLISVSLHVRLAWQSQLHPFVMCIRSNICSYSNLNFSRQLWPVGTKSRSSRAVQLHGFVPSLVSKFNLMTSQAPRGTRDRHVWPRARMGGTVPQPTTRVRPMAPGSPRSQSAVSVRGCISPLLRSILITSFVAGYNCGKLLVTPYNTVNCTGNTYVCSSFEADKSVQKLLMVYAVHVS